jgi:Gpi18-like mannosyltransferase
VPETPAENTRRAEWLLVAALITLALLARFTGRDVRTGDMDIFVSWYHQLVEQGLGAEIGNYNAPFLYLLAITTVLPGPVVLKIKAVWLVFDLVLALFAYKIGGWWAALIVVLLPTVVINASFYGQMDAMWASLALGAVYFLLRERPWWAVTFGTLALAIKPQGVFVFPLFLLLALAGRLPWRTLLAAPVVFVALDLPAVLLGRDPIELLTVYAMDRQARHVPALSLRAPSLYAYVPTAGPYLEALRTLGYVLAAAVILGVCLAVLRRRIELTPDRIVVAATLFAILTPYVLPGMHERYFFLADVLSVLLLTVRRRLWPVPLLVQAGSLLSYLPYLLGGRVPGTPPTAVGATLMLAALVIVAYDLLSPPADRPASPPARPA